ELAGVAPDLFEGVIGPGLGGEDVDDVVAVVDQHPAAFLRPLDPELHLAPALHLLNDLVGNGVALAPGRGRGDHEIVDEGRGLAEVQQEDLLAPVVVGDPGAGAGVLQGPGEALGRGPGGRAVGDVVLYVVHPPGQASAGVGGRRGRLGGGGLGQAGVVDVG